MTHPTRSLPPTADTPTWCRCGEYRATHGRPLCPICLDDEKKAAKK